MSNQFLKICTWNAQSVNNKKLELENFLNKYDIDIILISETFLKPAKSFFIQNYICYRKDRDDEPHGGVCILIKNTIKSGPLPDLNLEFIESIGIIVFNSNNEKIKIFCCYCRDSKSNLLRNDFIKLSSGSDMYLAGGDFNCRHSQWNCLRNNKGGRTLYSYASNTDNCSVVGSDEPSYYSYAGTPSYIDLFLTNSAPITSVKTLNELSSDHLPILGLVDFTPGIKTKNKIPNYKNCDWNFYKDCVNYHLFHNNISVEETQLNLSKTGVDDMVDLFTESIINAKNDSIPMTSIVSNRRLILTEEIIFLIKIRNTRRRQWQRTRNPLFKSVMNFVNNSIKLEISKLINKNWQNRLKNIEKSSKKYWKTVKNFNTRKCSIPPIKNETNGNRLFLNSDKCEEFANCFGIDSSSSISPYEIEVSNSINTLANSLIQNPETTNASELKDILKKIKPLKSPGCDEIQNILLKKLPDEALIALSNLYNNCLSLGYFPIKWKKASIIPIAKPGKDPTLAKNYRPISLLCTLGKLFEYVIKTRMANFIDSKNLIINDQFGFRESHSTVHQIHRIIDYVKLKRNDLKSTGMVLLDLEKAFDSVWTDGLIYKLLKSDFPIYIQKILGSFLKDRSYFVKILDSTSNYYPSNSGVPQGSVLSPILFNIFLNDIPRNDKCEIALFADDTAIFTANELAADTLNDLNNYIAILESYFSSWKLKLNASKCQAIYFTRCRAIRKIPSTNLKICNQEIPWEKCIKYLGVHLEPRITYKAHVEYIVNKCNKLFKRFYPLIGWKSKFNHDNKILLYKAMILNVILYGAPLWWGAANVHLKKLQVFQNKILKVILKVPLRFRTKDVHILCNINLIKDLAEEAKIRYNCKLPNINNELINNLSIL